MKQSMRLRAAENIKFSSILKAVNSLLNPNLCYTFTRCKDSGLHKTLLRFEDGNRVKNYKFGILYCKPGQTNEDIMFSNSKLNGIISYHQ